MFDPAEADWALAKASFRDWLQEQITYGQWKENAEVRHFVEWAIVQLTPRV